MLKKVTFAAAALTALAAFPAAAEAQRGYGYSDGYSRQYRGDDYRRYQRGDRYGSYDRYGSRGYDDRRYHDDDYRDGRRCSGTTGTIVGGVAGALAGRAIDRNGGRYSRRDSGTTGAIIGGALGALAGRAVDKSSCRNDRYYR